MSATPADARQESTGLVRVLALLAGVGWLLPVSEMSGEVGKLLNSRFATEFKLGKSAELLVFAVSALPLAFVHHPSPSILRVVAMHSGVFMLLATISLLMSPTAPFAILPWAETDLSASPVFGGPLLMWGVATIALLVADMVLEWRMRAKSMADYRYFIITGVAAFVSAVQWWVTVRLVVGGTLMHTVVASTGDKLIASAVVLIYLATAAFSCGVFGPKKRNFA